MNIIADRDKQDYIPDISIVLPVYNEAENIPTLIKELTSLLITGSLSSYKSEVIFVDDGSNDNSSQLILDKRGADLNIKLIRFSRNFGHQAAITAGMEYSRGNAVILMDSDLQDPPETLTDMIGEWSKGADVVYAVRKKRKESAWKRATYFIFYRVLQKISNIDIPLDSGDFCLMDRKVVDQMNQMPERTRFVRGLRSWVGFNQVALPYERKARFSGSPKYTLSSLIKLGLNGIFSFSTFPLKLATYLGFLVFAGGFVSLLLVIGAYFIVGEWPPGWASLIVLILFLGGVQLLILGAIGEYVALIHDEVKGRPTYIVSEFID